MVKNSVLNPASTRPVRAWHSLGHIHVALEDGRELRFPVKGNPRLETATPKQLDRIRLMPTGLNWPDVDEHLSIAGILRGNYGQKI